MRSGGTNVLWVFEEGSWIQTRGLPAFGNNKVMVLARREEVCWRAGE